VIRAYLGSGDEINPSDAAEAAAAGSHSSETPGTNS
jgi:branched-chain amino acid transport system ATP-binding protein